MHLNVQFRNIFVIQISEYWVQNFSVERNLVSHWFNVRTARYIIKSNRIVIFMYATNFKWFPQSEVLYMNGTVQNGYYVLLLPITKKVVYHLPNWIKRNCNNYLMYSINLKLEIVYFETTVLNVNKKIMPWQSNWA